MTRSTLWRWLPVIILALLFVGALAYLEHGRRGALTAKTLAEAEALRQAGIAVAAQTDAAGVRASLAGALERSAELAAEVARLKRASPGVRPVSTTTGTTGPVPVHGLPPADATSGGVGAGAPIEPQAPSHQCVLYEGDQGEVRLASATFATRGGNLVFVGAAEAWRAFPAPAVKLFGGALAAETTVEQPPGAPGWGGGVAGSVGSGGALAGLAVALPPARAWSLQLEATVAGEVNPATFKDYRIGATAVVRRWR